MTAKIDSVFRVVDLKESIVRSAIEGSTDVNALFRSEHAQKYHQYGGYFYEITTFRNSITH